MSTLRFTRILAAAAVGMSAALSAASNAATPFAQVEPASDVGTGGKQPTGNAVEIPLLNWSAPAYFNPPRGVFSSYANVGSPSAKAARTLATFVPIPPCRLVDTRGAFNPAIPSPLGAFTQSTLTEARSYQATGNCGIPAVAGVEGVSVAVTTLPTSNAGDVEVIAANATPGKTVLMVMAANEWNSGTTITPVDSSGKFQVIVRYPTTPTPTHMAIDVNGYYTAMDPANTSDYFSIIGNANIAGKGLLDVVQTGSVGAAIRGTGPGADVRLGINGAAIDIVSGDIRVEEADTNGSGGSAVFIHTTSAANVCDGSSGLDSRYTRLGSSPQTSGAGTASNLVLFVQQRGTGTTKAVSTVYVANTHCTAADAQVNAWYLFNSSPGFSAGESYNVMVVHP